ncbi:MAG: murein biosynthesis integral membrane protein MurJ [Candidatus Lustribacter sp.]|jgi:putative peptidoglycan lipid II flippase
MQPRLTVVGAQRSSERVARSTMIVMAATLASMILGFGREVLNARYFGASGDMDAFLAAAVVPTILFGVFNGALVSALVPIFSEYSVSDREEEAWQLASTLIIVLAVLLVVGAALGAWLAPVYVPWIARFQGHRLDEAIVMTRWLMPCIIATSLSGILAAILNAYHRFAATALQGVFANLLTIAFVVIGFHRLGIGALVLGTLAGAFAQLLVQVPAFFALRRFRIVVDWGHPGLRRLLMVLGPIAVGSAAGQVALFFDRYFASGLSVGSIAGMNYAVKLVGFPQQVFVAAIATVIFPVFAGQFASKNRPAMRRSIATGLKIVLFLTIPSVLGLCMLAGPIVQTLFERGAFTPADTVLCTSLLPFAAVGLVAVAGNIILTRYLFACNAVRATIVISVATVVVNVLLSLYWLPSLGARGLLLANAVSQTLQTAALGTVVWRLLGGFDLRGILVSAFKVLSCSAAMGVALAVVQIYRVPPEPTFVARSTNLIEHLIFGGFLFLALARIVDSEELDLAIDILFRRKARELVPLP